MNLLALVTQMRHWLADYGGYTSSSTDWEDDDSDALWGNEELTGYLNQAVHEYCRRNPIEDSSTTEICRISITSGTPQYALDSRILRIDNIRLVGAATPLAKLSQDEMDPLTVDWEAETGTIEGYLEDIDRETIWFYKNPTADATAALRVGRLPLKDLCWDANGKTPEVPISARFPIAYFAMHLAYMKDDDDTRNDRKASEWLDKWTLSGGNPISEQQMAIRRRASNRPMRTKSYY